MSMAPNRFFVVTTALSKSMKKSGMALLRLLLNEPADFVEVRLKNEYLKDPGFKKQ